MKRPTANLFRALLVLAMMTPRVAPAQSSPAPPGQLSYQGYLTDTNGLPLATSTPANYTLNFRIYSAATGGTPLWGEQQVVTVEHGYFTVLLGRGSSINTNVPFTNNLTGVFSDSTAPARYLGLTAIEVSTNEMAPRLRFLTLPYALLASKATTIVSPNGSNLLAAADGQLRVNGVLAGSGSGLTNLSMTSLTGAVAVARFPLTVVTNGASEVSLTGSISGKGGGLTNIPASAVVGTIPLGMVLISAGSFTMGNSTGDTDITDAPPTVVSVSAFCMDANLVTLSQWQSVYFWATNHGYTFANAGAGKGPNHPVTSVNWHDCVKWCNARSEQAGLGPVYYTDATQATVYRSGQIDITNSCVKWSTNAYRLPTEAEWEKAARGGLSGQRFPWGNLINKNLANYCGAPGLGGYDLGTLGYNTNFTNGAMPYTSPVGYFAPNCYGLNDMAGNVVQWCWDYYGVYGGGSDPQGPAGVGSGRVYRGGNWHDWADIVRCARRTHDSAANTNYTGFRCVRPSSPGL
jgi:formylglycine-generating enzyme required for sulfatase activity